MSGSIGGKADLSGLGKGRGAVVTVVLFHRKSGTIGAAVGLCRKETESRGVNIIRGRKGRGGRRLNTPPRPYDLPTFFPPQFPSTLVEPLGHLFLGKRAGSLHFLGQNLRKDFSLEEFRSDRFDCYFEIFISMCFSIYFSSPN